MAQQDNLPSWDLTKFYQNPEDPAIKADIQRAKESIAEFCDKYEGNVVSLTADELADAIASYEHIDEICDKLGSYAYLYYCLKMNDESRSIFYQTIFETINELTSGLLFFELEINDIQEQTLTKAYEASDKLKRYQPWLRDTRVFKPYQLDKQLEKCFFERNQTARSSWHRLFDETMASMQFEYHDQKLNSSEIFDLLSDAQPDTRKDAALSINQAFEAKKQTFTLITNVLAKDKSIEDKWRSFENPMQSRNVSNLIEDEVAQALISTVKDNYQAVSHRYYQLKKEWLGLDTLNHWDRNAPLPDQDNSYIAYSQALNTVRNAYEAFSPTMAKLMDQFKDGYIDAHVVDGKDSGAFSHPTVPSVHPYIMLNYQGKTRDVMTLAHELGHGIHQILAADQGHLMSQTPLTLAETASVFGEQLTFRGMLDQTKDPKTRKMMIASKVEDMINTVIRQTAFCDFEWQVHTKRQQGELSCSDICDIWMDVQSNSLGPAFNFDDSYRYYWMYIPHFIHTPFYVYAYAFGDCLVNSLYQVYLEGLDGFHEKYLSMLKAGGTLGHKELLAPFGLDASKGDFWQKGLDVIIGFIDELQSS